MKKITFCEIDNYISILINSSDSFYRDILFKMLKLLQKNHILVYRCSDLNLDCYVEYFGMENIDYYANDSKKFFIKKYPILIGKNITEDNLEFIANGWNGSFEREDTIVAAVPGYGSEAIELFGKYKNPYDLLNNPFIDFVITDGENPDDYQTVEIYMKKKSVSLIIDTIISDWAIK